MPFAYQVRQITHYELQTDYPNLWETIKKEFPALTIYEWAKIGSLVLGTCGHCHDDKTGCQCWNDE